MLTTLGLNPDPKQLDAMLKEAPGQLNFTHFLTLFGEKMHGKTASRLHGPVTSSTNDVTEFQPTPNIQPWSQPASASDPLL